MKTNKYIFGTVLALGLGIVGVAKAADTDMNKSAQYQAIVEATKGTTAPNSNAWTHTSKNAREMDERNGLGSNTILPSREPQAWEPKNFRNHY